MRACGSIAREARGLSPLRQEPRPRVPARALTAWRFRPSGDQWRRADWLPRASRTPRLLGRLVTWADKNKARLPRLVPGTGVVRGNEMRTAARLFLVAVVAVGGLTPRPLPAQP